MKSGYERLGPHSPVILIGEFGSGKTELAINLAMYWAEGTDCPDPLLVDLDLVTPYFRSREKRQQLEEAGVQVLYPDSFSEGIHLPVLPPAVQEKIESAQRCVVDVAGSEAGTRVLAGMSSITRQPDSQCVLVVNSYRPGSRSSGAIVRRARQLQQIGRLQIDAVFANANLAEATDEETVLSGLDIIADAAQSLDLPVAAVGVTSHLLEDGALPNRLDSRLQQEEYPAVVLHPRMRMQWQKGQDT